MTDNIMLLDTGNMAVG